MKNARGDTRRIASTRELRARLIALMAIPSKSCISKTAAGGIGSMRQATRSLSSWRKMHERPRRGCGLIRLPFHRGCTGKADGGRRSTCRTSYRWRVREERSHALRRCWVRESLTRFFQRLPIPSLATAKAISTTGSTAPITARLRRITEWSLIARQKRRQQDIG